MITQQKSEHILFFAIRVGEIMLKSGAETYRVEDTISRILSSHDFIHVDTFVTPTVIMATIKDEAYPVYSTLKRIKNRSTRLDKIEMINQLSRDYVLGQLSLEDAVVSLELIDQTPSYDKKWLIMATTFSSGFFSLMFRGQFWEFFISCLTGFIVAHIQHFLRGKEIINYFILFNVSLFIGTVVTLSSLFLPNLLNSEAIVIGCIMSLVPGVAFTNAIRDTIGDELLSGISRGVEAIFIAISIAAGVSIPMAIGVYLGGLIS